MTELEREARRMARKGIARETIHVMTKLPMRHLEKLLVGIRRPVNTKRVPDPTPEEILQRRREITPWMEIDNAEET